MASDRRQPGVVVILGPRGTGKSTLLRALVSRRSRRVVLDPLREHGALGAYVSVRECAARVLRSPTGPLALAVAESMDDDGADVCDASLALGVGVFAVDEADRWVTHHPQEPWVEHVERGRHYGVDLVLATRRPSRLWRTATANADYLYAFRTWEPRDVSYLRDYGGPHFVPAALAELPRWRFLQVDCRTGAVWQGYVDPRSGALAWDGPVGVPDDGPVQGRTEPLEAPPADDAAEEAQDDDAPQSGTGAV